MSKFIHLQNHTDYSLLEAITTNKELVESAKEFDQPGIAITDNGVMYGVFKFQKMANKHNIKPIIGMDAYVAPESRFDKSATPGQRNYNRLVLLAKNNTGYKNLVKLSSKGFTEGFYYKPRIDDELLKIHSEGLICLSGNTAGQIARFLTNANIGEAERLAKFYHEIFGDDFYLQIQHHGLQFDDKICKEIPEMGERLGIKVVATNDTYYQRKEHATAHNVHLYIRGAGRDEVDVKNLRFGSDQFYIRSSEEMKELFKDNPEAISNTVEIYEKCDVSFESKIYMPEFPIPEESPSETKEEYLRELVYKGLEQRYDEINDEIRERADYELKVINDMEFPGYFLVVWDFIRAAKEMNVRVGPGRGSAAGSLVAYALEITNVDPLKYDLLFERFLNPDRESMPDIDIDFSDNKRERVIEYVKNVYGEDAVAMIITFGTLSSKAVLSDVGRVLKIPFNEVKKITSKIPTVRGKVTPLPEALKLPELKFLKGQTDPKIDQLIEYSLLLEGRNRTDSIHPAGVIIAPGDLTNYVPISIPKKAEESSVKYATQFTMKELEEAGLLKMDFLGLKTLSIIDNTLEQVKRNHGVEIDMDEIDLNDQKTYEIFSSNKALAIFQFESQGMQEWLKKLKPQSIEDLTAMNALYRPGPMDNIGEFIDRKYGRKEIQYLHPKMEKSLNKTYGIIVYQEQVMELVQDIAGLSLAQADILRRAMGKKLMHIMNSMKPKFIEGAQNNGIDKKLAEEIWNLIDKFADYGFNKSHALAYSLLAYQTAWLKAHYTAEFLAANMTSELNSQKKIVKLIDDAKSFGIEVQPPDINKSNIYFDVRDGKIYSGLAVIKGVGVGAVELMLEAREENEFSSFADFCKRVSHKVVNKKTLESLIKAGAFDPIEDEKRAALFMSIDMAIDYSKSFSDEETSSIDSMFGGIDGQEDIEFKLPEVEEWDQKQRLKNEKEVLNFYVSGHPLNEYSAVVNAFNKFTLDQSSEEIRGSNLTFCGFISDVQKKSTRDNRAFAIIVIEDYYDKAECFVWTEEYENLIDKIEEDKVVLLEGEVKDNEEDIKIVVKNILDIDEALDKYINGYKLWLDLNDKNAQNKLDVLKNQFFSESVTPKQIYFNIFDNDSGYKNCYKSKDANIPVDSKTIFELQKIFENRVSLILKSENGAKRYS